MQLGILRGRVVKCRRKLQIKYWILPSGDQAPVDSAARNLEHLNFVYQVEHLRFLLQL